jgi:hypothetical protein
VFILLEVMNPPTKMRVVSPDGHVLALPEEFFGDEPEEFAGESVSATFPEVQLEAMRRWIEEQAIREAAERQRPSHPPREISERSRASAPRRSKPKPPPGPGQMRAEWSASRLCFYKNKIESLRPQDFFRVKVDGEGVYVITRAEFQDNFNDVLLDAGYRQMGYFAYGETPPKAAKFLKA